MNRCLLIAPDLDVIYLSLLREAPQRIDRRGDVDARRESTSSMNMTGLEPPRLNNDMYISGAQAALSDFKNQGCATVTKGQSP